MKKTYDLIYSIGYACASTAYLKMHFLRSFSGPFDWTTNTDFASHLDIILNDFKDFMNKEDFVSHTNWQGEQDRCDVYINKKTNMVFPHDFLLDVPFDEIFPLVKEKYERRIARFYKKIQESEKVLLVWFQNNAQTPDEIITTKCNALMEKLGKKIDILVIEHDAEKTAGEIEYRHLSKEITHVLAYIKENDQGINGISYGNKKICHKIYKNYQLKMSCFKRFYLHTKKYAIKILCAFVPSKELRRKLKKDL